LINAFADIYDEHIFNGEKLGLLLAADPLIPLTNISFNATEFTHALQFRFQVTDPIKNPLPDEPPYGIIGNYYHNIPREQAAEIRLADILAASSCFPGGFEPITFPTDFVLPGNVKIKLAGTQFPVALMDGGIVDNQGIEPILLAEKRIARNNQNTTSNGPAIDLIIVSDVASPYMESFQAVTKVSKKGLHNVSPALILTANSILLLIFITLMIFSYSNSNLLLLLLSSMLTALSLCLFVITRLIGSVFTKLPIPETFRAPLSKLLKLKIYVYETLISNRVSSLLKLSGDVFLKHVRRLNYKQVFESASWKNRRIMNAVYELRTGEAKLKEKLARGEIREELKPSEVVQKLADKASSMGTTLWFTEDELDPSGSMLDALIATGQFTVCWNLLEYIGKIKRDPANTSENHKIFYLLEDQLTADWKQFQANPLFLLYQFKDHQL
jgi:hypothetical protein